MSRIYSPGSIVVARKRIWVPDGTSGPVVLLNQKSLQFDGVDEYVDFGLNYNFQRTDSFSIAFWAKTTLGGTAFSTLSPDALHRGWQVIFYNAGAGVVLALGLNSNEATSNLLVVQTSSAITVNTWTFWVITYDGSSTGAGIKIYKDGDPEAVTTAIAALSGTIVSNTPLSMARISNGNYYNGLLDEPAIWSGVKLSAADAAALYNAGVPINISTYSTPASSWWRNGDQTDTISTIFDRIGSVNGTPTNMEAGDIVSDVP